MIRFLMSSVAAVMLLAAPVAASAATTPPPPAATAKPAKPKHVVKASAKPGKAMAKPVRRDPAAAAVDSLNDQSLAKAKAGQ